MFLRQSPFSEVSGWQKARIVDSCFKQRSLAFPKRDKMRSVGCSVAFSFEVEGATPLKSQWPVTPSHLSAISSVSQLLLNLPVTCLLSLNSFHASRRLDTKSCFHFELMMNLKYHLVRSSFSDTFFQIWPQFRSHRLVITFVLLTSLFWAP